MVEGEDVEGGGGGLMYGEQFVEFRLIKFRSDKVIRGIEKEV